MIASVREIQGTTVVELAGRVDAATAPEIKARLHELIDECAPRLVLCLRDLSFVDSSGLGVFVSCLRRCAASGGDMCVAEAPEFARSIFELTRLTRVFRLFDSEQEAAESMKAEPGR